MAILISICLAGSVAVAQNDGLWEESPLDEPFHKPEKKDDCPDPGYVAEPVFALIVGMAEADSCGVWDQQDLLDFQVELGRVSQFPLDLIQEFSRQRPSPEDLVAWPGVPVRAVWSVTLPEPLDKPLPYSILGYNPGSLRTSATLRMAEVYVGDAAGQGGDGAFAVTEAYLYRLEDGYLELDVDGWLDRLLGKRLDDAASLGFVHAREEGRRVAVAVSIGRKGRKIYGEFDFCRDKILANGRDGASLLSAFARELIMVGVDDPVTRAWPAP